MRHAIMIMAHKDTAHVCRTASYFKEDCDVFVHFDKKSKITEEDAARLREIPWVKDVTSEYNVNWGGTSVLECELHMLEKAVKNSDADYFHLISGQDYPIRPLAQFLRYFDDNGGKEFLQYSHLPHRNWEDNTFRRLQYFYPYDWAVGREDNPRRWVNEQVHRQMEQGQKRPLPTEFDHLYGGSQWFSITRKAATVLLDYTRSQPSFYQRMWMTFAPEECYVATVLANLLDKETIVPTNLRFIRWRNENGNRPANLGAEHLFRLLGHDCFFARKFERGVSEALLDSIDQYLLEDHPVKPMPNGGWDYDGLLSYGYDANFGNFITQLAHDTCATAAADMGCGAGLYVAQWRNQGLPFVGYDCNPHTPHLALLLMPDDEGICDTYDITDDTPLDRSFDLVVCKDVLQFVPTTLLQKAADNLSAMSSHVIVLSWNDTGNMLDLQRNPLSQDDIARIFGNGFGIDNYMTARLCIAAGHHDCCVMLRHGKQLLESLA